MASELAGYCITDTGQVYLWQDHQESEGEKWPFSILDDDQCWPGGFGVGTTTRIEDTDPRITDDDRDRLECVLDHIRDGSPQIG